MFCGATQTLNTPIMSPSFKMMDYMNQDTTPGVPNDSLCYQTITHVHTAYSPDMAQHHQQHLQQTPHQQQQHLHQQQLQPSPHHQLNAHQALSLQMMSNHQMDSQSSLIHSNPSPNSSHRNSNPSPLVPPMSSSHQPMQHSSSSSSSSPSSTSTDPSHPLISHPGQMRQPQYVQPHQPNFAPHLSLNNKGMLSINGHMFPRRSKAMQHFMSTQSPYSTELTGFHYGDHEPTMMPDCQAPHHHELAEDSNCSDMSDPKYMMNSIQSMNGSNRTASTTLQLSQPSGSMSSLHMYPPKLSSALAAAAAASGYNFSFAGDIVPMTFKANLDLGGNFIGNNYTAKELTPKRNCGRKPNHVKDEDLSPEEQNRRRIRRERNKEAAARCRQRRLDQANQLEQDKEAWIDKKKRQEEEIQVLQKKAQQLEFLLQTHSCCMLPSKQFSQ